MTVIAHPVIVVVTSTPADKAAVRLATAEALLREQPLHLLAPYAPTDPHARPAGWATQLGPARNAMLSALAWLRATQPQLPVDYWIAPGDPADVVVGRSAEAAAVVVPALPAVGGTPTIAERIASYAHCPVLVSHVPATPGGDVVIGLDGAAPAEPLVQFGFEAAALRGVPLRPILVWGALPKTAFGTLAFDRASANNDAHRLLAEELAGWSEKQPDVVVHRQAVYGPDIAGALTRFASDAALLVVGDRSRPARSSQTLGTVPRRLIRSAPCPVAVVRMGP